MINVLVVDDHTIVREGLCKLIQFEQDMIVAGVAKDAPEALRIISKQKTDVVILDISLPGRSGLDIIKDLKKLQPGSRILMLSMYREERFALRAFKSGASGYLTKEMASEEIVKAIRKVYSGGKYITPWLAEKLVEELNAPSEPMPHERLSDREFQVMYLIAAGKSIREIADDFAINEKSVATYRTRILAKMKLKTTTEITKYAIDNGLCE